MTYTLRFNLDAAVASAISVNDTLFVNGVGPLIPSAVSTQSFSVETTLFEAGGNGFTKWRVFKATHNSDVKENSILLMDGRRYKVDSVADVGFTNNSKVLPHTLCYLSH